MYKCEAVTEKHEEIHDTVEAKSLIDAMQRWSENIRFFAEDAKIAGTIYIAVSGRDGGTGEYIEAIK